MVVVPSTSCSQTNQTMSVQCSNASDGTHLPPMLPQLMMVVMLHTLCQRVLTGATACAHYDTCHLGCTESLPLTPKYPWPQPLTLQVKSWMVDTCLVLAADCTPASIKSNSTPLECSASWQVTSSSRVAVSVTSTMFKWCSSGW